MQRGVGYSQVQQSEHECPSCKAKGFAQSILGPNRCTFCDGAEGGNPPTEVERAQADSLEAHSLKYHHCAQIFLLESGRFALFGAYSLSEPIGIPLITIGTWSELEPHVRAYRLLADERAARPRERRASINRQPSADAINYNDLFGDQS